MSAQCEIAAKEIAGSPMGQGRSTKTRLRTTPYDKGL